MNERHPSTLSDEELVESIRRVLDEQRREAIQALADVYAGRRADPCVLDLLYDFMDEDEVDAVMEANDRLRTPPD